MNTRTAVIFRVIDGECVAIFPELPGTSDPLTCCYFVTNGGHGSAPIGNLIMRGYPASPTEYEGALKALQSYPYEYDLVIRKRVSYRMNRIRHERAKE